MAELWKQLDAIDLANAKLRVKQMRTIEKAIRSDSPDDILRAQKALNTIQQKENQAMQPKAFLLILLNLTPILDIRISHSHCRTLHSRGCLKPPLSILSLRLVKTK